MVDVGYSSFYIYKKENGKLFSGPLWDFDISSGNCDYHEEAIIPEYLWAAKGNPWYSQLLEYQEFRDLVASKLKKYQPKIEDVIEGALDFALSMEQSFDRNFELWKVLGVYIAPNSQEIAEIKTWQGQVEYLQEFLRQSLDNLLNVYVGNT